MKLRRKTGESFAIYFQYERLPQFYFICGVIGHSEQFCESLYVPKDDPPAFCVILAVVRNQHSIYSRNVHLLRSVEKSQNSTYVVTPSLLRCQSNGFPSGTIERLIRLRWFYRREKLVAAVINCEQDTEPARCSVLLPRSESADNYHTEVEPRLHTISLAPAIHRCCKSQSNPKGKLPLHHPDGCQAGSPLDCRSQLRAAGRYRSSSVQLDDDVAIQQAELSMSQCRSPSRGQSLEKGSSSRSFELRSAHVGHGQSFFLSDPPGTRLSTPSDTTLKSFSVPLGLISNQRQGGARQRDYSTAPSFPSNSQADQASTKQKSGIISGEKLRFSSKTCSRRVEMGIVNEERWKEMEICESGQDRFGGDCSTRKENWLVTPPAF